MLNSVETTLSIAGKRCHFVTLSLDQKFNDHHTFKAVVDFEELDDQWMENPTKIIKLIGCDVNIEMRHLITGEESLFGGVITNVSMVGYHGKQNSIVITGCSPTIKLHGKKTMDSFSDSSLDLIVKESVANSGNGAEITVKPEYSGELEYMCQYNETSFEFLNRLSWLYGEWFFYDGVNSYFGKPDSIEEVDLIYDIDITQFNLTAGLQPAKFNRYDYLLNTDSEIDSDAPESINGVRGYIKVALDKSIEFYNSNADLPSEPLITNKAELDKIVEVEKTRAVGNMLVMEGETKTCKVQIGKIVNVKLPKTMNVEVKDVESFLVIEVCHCVDQRGYYTNTFKGIPSGLSYIPMQPVLPPRTSSQMATVLDNSDSKGRIKVQLQWQKKKGKSTNWIRVQTPDAGGSDKVSSNRGLVTIPEVGDTVMVGFEYGDPNRPFSMGSIFLQKFGGGGGAGNKSKSLTSRSGNAMTLDDETGSVLLVDSIGSSIELDGSKNISILDEKKITIQSGATMITLDGENDEITIQAKTITIQAEKLVSVLSSEVVSIEAGTELSAQAVGNTTVASQAEVTVQGNSKATLTATGAVVVDGAVIKLN